MPQLIGSSFDVFLQFLLLFMAEAFCPLEKTFVHPNVLNSFLLTFFPRWNEFHMFINSLLTCLEWFYMAYFRHRNLESQYLRAWFCLFSVLLPGEHIRYSLIADLFPLSWSYYYVYMKWSKDCEALRMGTGRLSRWWLYSQAKLESKLQNKVCPGGLSPVSRSEPGAQGMLEKLFIPRTRQVWKFHLWLTGQGEMKLFPWQGAHQCGLSFAVSLTWGEASGNVCRWRWSSPFLLNHNLADSASPWCRDLNRMGETGSILLLLNSHQW